jgi:hypothetical protein
VGLVQIYLRFYALLKRNSHVTQQQFVWAKSSRTNFVEKYENQIYTKYNCFLWNLKAIKQSAKASELVHFEETFQTFSLPIFTRFLPHSISDGPMPFSDTIFQPRTLFQSVCHKTVLFCALISLLYFILQANLSVTASLCMYPVKVHENVIFPEGGGGEATLNYSED